VPALLDGLQATPVSRWALPGGLKAGVWRVPDTGWASPTGRALQGR
jgi:hypothetical protein